MKILALETTEKFGSVALLDGNHILAEITLPKDRRSSQTLHPALQSLFETTQIKPNEINIVAVITGPGSFTGLRVGVATAKIFAYTTGAKIIALDTFQTVAAATQTPSGITSVGVDAQRGEVVAAILRQTETGHIEFIKKPALMATGDWWKHAEHHHNIAFTGPALERWGNQAPSSLTLAKESDWFPQASIAGKLAIERITSEQFNDTWSLLPDYSRPSAAEEKRNGGPWLEASLHFFYFFALVFFCIFELVDLGLVEVHVFQKVEHLQ
jgi:tRNA threonylcarbamoyladenosine biosynthesis protein TsaB